MPADGYIDVNNYFRALWKRRMLIGAGSIALGLAALVVSLFLPRVYEAKATLILIPPRFSTELRPEALPVETYQSIAESEGIKHKVMQSLEKKGLPPKDGEIDGELTTALYPSISRDRTYLPLIDLVVEADSPEKASLIADAWANTLLGESSDLTQRASLKVVDFIEKEFQEASERLRQAEDELALAQNQGAKALAEAEQRWQKRIADFQAEWDLDGIEAELATIRSLLTVDPLDGSGAKNALIPQLEQLRVETQLAKDTLDQLTREISAHTQFVTLSKAITNDALWQNVAGGNSGKIPEDLEDMKLRSEEINPVYASLAQQLADTKVRYQSLVPQQAFLENQIAALRQRLVELNQLLVRKKLEMGSLIKNSELELDRLKRESDLREKQLARKMESANRTYATLAQKYESARLVKGEEDTDIKIGAQAAASPKPVGPKVLLNTAVALATGLMLMIGLSLVLEFSNGRVLQDLRKAPAISRIRASH